MIETFSSIPKGKKIFFASDFHLGAPNPEESKKREKKITAWLDEVADQAACIMLVGDIFDFWFEYKHAIPKGHARFMGKIASLSDRGIPIIFFTGNHDLWMENYFPDEFGVMVYREPQAFNLSGKKFYIGHGDGLGPGDRFYKVIKKLFTNSICQWLFHRIHPNLGVGLAKYWSGKSRATKIGMEDEFLGEKEWLIQYATTIERQAHHDYYLFGHRHLPIEFDINQTAKYVNLGEWIKECTYAVFDGEELLLKKFNH